MCQILLQAVAHINKGNSQKFNEDDRSVNWGKSVSQSSNMFFLGASVLVDWEFTNLSQVSAPILSMSVTKSLTKYTGSWHKIHFCHFFS